MKINNDKYLQRNNRPVILSGEHVTKSFGGIAAVTDVDFQLYESEILGLMGPNGAGKTTLFNLIAGVLKPDRGIIRFKDKIISDLRPDKICKEGVARTFQIPKPFNEMRVIENVMVGSYFGSHGDQNIDNSRAHAEEILSFVGLINKRNVVASKLTLMERKKLEIARSLSTKPTVVLFDEVVAGLNPTESMEMIDLINKIREKGKAIIIIEHVMKAMMGISDRVIALVYGKKIAEGSPMEIVNNPSVIEAYLGKGFNVNANNK